MSDTKKPRPQFKLYSVTGKNDNARWVEIGGAWASRDDKGFTLSLNALPINGRIVMRLNEPKDQE